MKSTCGCLKKVYLWRRTGELKLTGHSANGTIFTWQIHLPFNKKSGSSIARTGWNEGMNPSIKDTNLCTKKHIYIKNRHAYLKFTLCHISFIHNTGRERRKKPKQKRCKSETSQYVKQIGQSVRQVLSRGATRASGPENDLSSFRFINSVRHVALF